MACSPVRLHRMGIGSSSIFSKVALVTKYYVCLRFSSTFSRFKSSLQSLARGFLWFNLRGQYAPSWASLRTTKVGTIDFFQPGMTGSSLFLTVDPKGFWTSLERGGWWMNLFDFIKLFRDSKLYAIYEIKPYKCSICVDCSEMLWWLWWIFKCSIYVDCS